MLVSVNIPTTDSKRARPFYQYLLGNKLVEHPFSKQALYANVLECAFTMFPRHQVDERTICYFEVDDLNKAINDLANLGGKLLVKPFSIKAGKISREAAVVEDLDGNGVGLVTKS